MGRKQSKKGWFDWATGGTSAREEPVPEAETGRLNETLDQLEGLIDQAVLGEEDAAADGARNAANADTASLSPEATPIPLLEDVLDDAPGPAVMPVRSLADAIDHALSEQALSEIGAQHLYQELVQELEEVLRTSLAQVQKDMEQAMHSAVRRHVNKAIQHMAEAARRSADGATPEDDAVD
jgi:hypothetical protein